jgi:predicted DNA-binding transcriptional regulator AlpA
MNKNRDGERLLTTREVADILGTSPAAVWKAFQRGDLPGFRLYGRKGGPIRFRLSELESLLETWRWPTPRARSKAPDAPD